MARLHCYTTRVTWTGNLGTGTSHYRAYSRAHEVAAGELPVILGSSDPTFHGDASRWNPEQLLLAALSQCHMLSYLHFCTLGGVVVTSYVDEAAGTMGTAGDSGQFTEAVVRPGSPSATRRWWTRRSHCTRRPTGPASSPIR